MKLTHRLLVGAVIAAAISPAAMAQGVLTEKQISLSMAQDIAQGAVEQCRKDGYRVTAAVVDRAGQLRALLRDDGTGPHTLDTSRRKAYTSATLKTSTVDLAARLAANPASAGLKDVDNILVLGGGVPIKVGTETIGGIGVGGAPGGDKDEVCALAGLAKVADQLK